MGKERELGREIERIGAEIVDAAVKLHIGLGPGLLESVYHTLLRRELERRGLNLLAQKPVSFEYDGVRFVDGLRVDLLVEDVVVVELKAIEQLAPVHFRQVLTYLRLLNAPLGFLINFGALTMKDGLHRLVNNHRPPPDSTLRIHRQEKIRRSDQSGS